MGREVLIGTITSERKGIPDKYVYARMSKYKYSIEPDSSLWLKVMAVLMIVATVLSVSSNFYFLAMLNSLLLLAYLTFIFGVKDTPPTRYYHER